MRRFFLRELREDDSKAELSGAEFVHLSKVLRAAPGDEISLFNGNGVELSGRVEAIGRHSAVIDITGKIEPRPECPVRIELFQGLLKGDRPELIVQKATELGAAKVTFFTSERTVPVNRRDSRVARLEKAAIEAAKQCGRAFLPEICEGMDFRDAIKVESEKIILWEGEGAPGIKKILSGRGRNGIALFVGPEGGFTIDELELARSSGAVPVSLGPRIMRAETAAIAALAIVNYECGDLGG